MRPTFDLGLAEYKVSLNRLIAEKRADAKLLLREEARLFVRDIVAFTPPKTFAQGRAAVARDLAQVYGTPERMIAEAGERGDHNLAVALAAALAKGQMRQFAHLLMGGSTGAREVRVSGYSRGGRTVSGYSTTRSTYHANVPNWAGGVVKLDVDPSLHRRRLTRYGRIAGQRLSQIVWAAKSLRDYVRKIQEHVGWAKAGWAATAQLVGQALPSFVRRHAGKAPSQVSETPAPSHSITMINRSSAIPNYQAMVNAALRRRQASLISEARRILAGGKSRRGSLAGTATGSSG